MKKTILFLSIFAFVVGGCKQVKKQQVQTDISYQTTASTGISYKVADNIEGFNSVLLGLVGELQYEIDLTDYNIQCLRIIEQLDFDEDSFTDALIEHNCCGGNGALNTYFFVSYKGNGYFQVTEQFGYTWDNPIIEKWDNKISVVVKETNIGSNTDDEIDITERYILENGKALLVESIEKEELTALEEIRASEFSFDNRDEIKYLYFDLDGDNINDTITCTFWDRWGSILVDEIKFSSGIIIKGISTGCKRIGVLETKTNNINDLVCGIDYILRWNGTEYE
jgi:hypothetical protein